MSKKDANRVKKLLLKAVRKDLKLSFFDKIQLGTVLLKNKLTYTDAVGFFTKYVGGWGEKQNVYAYKAFRQNKCFKEVRKGFNEDYRFDVRLSASELHHQETYDVVKVEIKKCNAFDEIAFYDTSIIRLNASSHLEVIGPAVRVLQGGVCAVWLKTRRPGQGSFTLETPLGTQHYNINIT